MIDRIPQDEFRELTPEEAQEAYDNAPSIPLSKERIDEIVAYATGKHDREKLFKVIRNPDDSEPKPSTISVD